jgi:hypothetical protein
LLLLKMDQGTAYQALRAVSAWYAQNFYNDAPVKPDLSYNFWQKSNQLDSYLRLASLAEEAWGPLQNFWNAVLYGTGTNPPRMGLIENFRRTVSAAVTVQTLWSDDYGWGGMACTSAAEYLLKHSPALQDWQQFRKLAAQCYNIQVERWDSTDDAKPVLHGLSNCPPNAKPNNYAKNTVTNANFFALSIHAYEFFKTYPEPTFPNMSRTGLFYAYQQYLWFRDWIHTKRDNDDHIPYNYWHTTRTTHITDAAMLEERPVAKPPQGTYPISSNPPFTPHSSWSGDQGLFLYACALLYKHADEVATLNPPGNPTEVRTNTRRWIQWILRGVYTCLCSPNVDQVLRESPFQNLFSDGPFGDAPDYVCGRGVLARYLTKDTTVEILREISTQYASFTPIWSETAVAINKTRGAGSTFTASWNESNDEKAYDRFVVLWGDGDPTYHWTDRKTPIWANYCQMMGFDVLGAWLKTTVLAKEKNETSHEETKATANGVHSKSY